MSWIVHFSPKSQCCTSCAYRYDINRKWRICRCEQIKIRCLGWVLIERELEHGQMCTRWHGMSPWRKRLPWCTHGIPEMASERSVVSMQTSEVKGLSGLRILCCTVCVFLVSSKFSEVLNLSFVLWPWRFEGFREVDFVILIAAYDCIQRDRKQRWCCVIQKMCAWECVPVHGISEARGGHNGILLPALSLFNSFLWDRLCQLNLELDWWPASSSDPPVSVFPQHWAQKHSWGHA